MIEFYVLRVRVPNAVHWLYYDGGTLGYPGATVPFDRAQHFLSVDLAKPVLEQMAKAGDVGYVHPVVKYGDELVLEESVADNAPAPTAALLHAKGPAEFILALADSFPCLRGKVEGCGFTAKTWDVDRWVKYSGPWSHGERLAAMFVAVVWNWSDANAKKWKFDAIDAVSVWDTRNRAAFIAWAQKPVWP